MSLKNAERSRSWSITGRLIFLFTASTTILLLVAVFFLYWVLNNNFERQDNQFLADQVHVLRVILRERPNDESALDQEVKWEGVTRQFTKYYVRILDESGSTLMESTQMGVVLKPAIFVSPIADDQEPSKSVKWKSVSGKSFRLISALASEGVSGARRQIQIALDVSHEDKVIAEYRNKLGLVIFLGILLSSMISLGVARSGLQPLSEITKKAQRITAAQLHERIDPQKWPEELRTLALAFDDMLGRLEESFERLSQFSADLAHELRSPVHNLMGEAGVALSKPRTSEEYRTVLESSIEELNHLSRMIDNLLFLARAEKAETKINRSKFDIFKEIEVVREFHDIAAEEQDVEVASQGNAQLEADPILFRRAVSNLLSNAIQYTPRGGKIKIEARQPDQKFVELVVSDTGSGIDPEHLPKIFDRFYRADQSRTNHPQGTGLGLSIVKSIMDLHGGKVSIASQPNQGTTVTLQFPSA